MLLIMVVLTGLTIALPAAIQYMIDVLIPGLESDSGGSVDMTPVLLFGAVLMGIYFFEMVFAWLRDYLAAYIGAEIIKDIRLELYTHLQRLSLRFHAQNQVGEVMSRILSDVGRLQELLTTTLLMIFTNVLLLAGILGYLLYTDWKLTLVAVALVPVTVLAARLFGIRLNRLVAIAQQKLAEVSAKIQESLAGLKTIKAFGQEKRESQTVNMLLGALNPVLVKASVTNSMATNTVQFINMVGPIVVLAWGTYLVASGGMLLGALIAFYILLTYLHSPVRGLTQAHLEIQSAMASADRVFAYLDIEPEVRETDAAVSIRNARGELVFDKIGFAYSPEGFALRRFSLEIGAKEKVALVGPSGSGKTTLINLLMRFFDPQEGAITLDGIDLRNLSLDSLRKEVALVEQDPLLFKLSIRDNIAYGKPEASEEEIVAAATAANIDQFIASLPQGYDTEVGERGVTVSGGEKQRLCLARAILMNPSVLILDEATSALDSNSETLIQRALDQVLADKTAVIIAHRLATIKNVDRIVAIEDGRIVDEGTHRELIDRCPLYRELAQKQMLA